jgi:hypothetical protein|tara:strand:- start:1766 stop:2047 length:282 start_codon:yes stop_codon:yes gene_type:complete
MAKKQKSIKFSKEELNGLQAIRNDYQSIQNEFGALRVRRLQLQQQLDLLDSREVELDGLYVQVQSNERNLSQELTEKYGNGNLDFDTGEFTPE